MAQFRRLMVAVKGFLMVFRHAAALLIIDSQLEQCLGISRQGRLLEGFYIDGIGRECVFLVAVIVGSVVHFTNAHWRTLKQLVLS